MHEAFPSPVPHDKLRIGSLTLSSRLILGTSQYPDPDVLRRCIEVSATSMVTVAIRRVDLTALDRAGSLLQLMREMVSHLLPNTAGCFTAREAVLTARLAREVLGVSRVKLEVIGDDYSLYPDAVELLAAARELIQDGFEIYPYCPDDVVVCQRLADLGSVCVMPLASPIGSGRGLVNPFNLNMIRQKVQIPIIVDAGLGTASDACLCFEHGADGVLVNSAIAKSGHPVQMAAAFRDACLAGRAAYQAKRIAIKERASASTSDEGKIGLYKYK